METRLTRSKSNLDQVMQSMIEHQKSKNYLEAEQLRKQSEKLKEQIANLEKKSTKKKQKKQKEELTSMQQEEIQSLRDGWNLKITQFEEKSAQQMQQLKKKQEQQLTQVQIEFDTEEKQYHDSGYIIELKRKEQIYAKQTNFMEAHYVQTERLKLENQQKEMMKKLRHEKLKITIRKLKKQHEAEVEVLKKKTETKLFQMKKTMETELKTLQQKYKNIVTQLTMEQEKQNLLQSGLLKTTVYAEKNRATTSKMTSPIKKIVSQKLMGLSTQ